MRTHKSGINYIFHAPHALLPSQTDVIFIKYFACCDMLCQLSIIRRIRENLSLSYLGVTPPPGLAWLGEVVMIWEGTLTINRNNREMAATKDSFWCQNFLEMDSPSFEMVSIVASPQMPPLWDRKKNRHSRIFTTVSSPPFPLRWGGA